MCNGVPFLSGKGVEVERVGSALGARSSRKEINQPFLL